MALPGAFPIPAPRPGEPPVTHWVAAIELTASEFGRTAGGIGIVIVLASIIGVCLLASGSADKIVRRFLAVFGEQRAGFALLLATYVVSIPIFFDTLFMLLVPVAVALYLRLRRDYMLFVMAICCAGVITHSMAIPHPGPLAMVEKLNAGRTVLETGTAIAAGLLSGVGPLLAGWVVCRWVNRTTPAVPPAAHGGAAGESAASLDVPESQLPSFLAAVTPVILPVLLISIASFTKAFAPQYPRTYAWLTFVGERHVALTIGVVIAAAVLIRQKGLSFGRVTELMGPPLETAGVIILITAAGGAFGAMLRAAGVGGAIERATAGMGINLIVLSWFIAIVIRIAQGSATVAMLTTAGIVEPLMRGAMSTPDGLPYHPLYLFLAIGYGAFGCSWMNDSGFWVVSRLGGLTERQTLRSWTVLLTACSVVGLLTTWAAATIMPLKRELPPKPAAATSAVVQPVAPVVRPA
jgi:GntP family gluconate:H+ symporter